MVTKEQKLHMMQIQLIRIGKRVTALEARVKELEDLRALEESIKQADAGEFATEDEVKNIFDSYTLLVDPSKIAVEAAKKWQEDVENMNPVSTPTPPDGVTIITRS